MQQVVLDTNVLVAALRSSLGASHQLLRIIDQGSWQANISVALALEYEDVLHRENLVPGLDTADLDAFLDYILRFRTSSRQSLVTGQACRTRTTSVFWRWRSNAEPLSLRTALGTSPLRPA